MILIRLNKISSSKIPLYKIVVSDSKNAVHKSILDTLGFYRAQNDTLHNKYVWVNMDRLDFWLSRGAVMNKAIYSLIRPLLFLHLK